MAKNKRKQKLLIAGAVLVVLLALIGTVALIKALQPKEQDPYKQTETSQSDTKTPDTNADDETEADSQTSKQPAQDTEPQSTLDPATVGTIDIAPMNITVSYVKGVGGFEYEIVRRPNGTQYVEFRSTELAGTKCTNDQGAFASVLADPQNDEAATLAKTTTLDGTKYGLSLASENCTANVEKLREYQKSFGDAFSLLKKLN